MWCWKLDFVSDSGKEDWDDGNVAVEENDDDLRDS